MQTESVTFESPSLLTCWLTAPPDETSRTKLSECDLTDKRQTAKSQDNSLQQRCLVIPRSGDRRDGTTVRQRRTLFPAASRPKKHSCHDCVTQMTQIKKGGEGLSPLHPDVIFPASA